MGGFFSRVVDNDNMPEYRKKPIIIDAIQWTGDNDDELAEFMGSKVDYLFTSGKKLLVPTLEGDLTATVGDFIIKGVAGEFCPCKPEIFKEIYEAVS